MTDQTTPTTADARKIMTKKLNHSEVWLDQSEGSTALFADARKVEVGWLKFNGTLNTI